MGENLFQNKIPELAEVLDLYLQGKCDADKKNVAIAELKKLLGAQGEGNIAIAQINPTPGVVRENAKKVMKYIKIAEALCLDMIVFPEIALMGYMIYDTIDRHPVIVEENVRWLKEIAKLTTKTTALVGFIEPRNGQVEGKRYYNSVAVLENGKISSIIRKSLLPTYSEFEDYRYVEPSPVVGGQPPETLCNFGKDSVQDINPLNAIAGRNYGVAICEDIWNDKDFFSNPLYELDPVAKIAKHKPDAIINCSASPSREKKEQLKHNMLSFSAKKYSTPIIYANQVGALDNSSFDGSSRVYGAEGQLIARAKSFEEQFFICNPFKSAGKIYPLATGLEKTLTSQKAFTLDYEPDLDRTYKTILQGIRDYFSKNGFKRAVLGLSGGLDSSVCAVLLADALGADNVFGISMSSVLTSQDSKDDAKELARNLGINFAKAPIRDMVNTINEGLNPLFDEVESVWNCRYKNTFTQDNVQARARALLLWGLSNEFADTITIATSDKSELYMGYATINGDMSGGFAPIADVPKTKLFALAAWMNKNRETKNAIPKAILEKPPGAELAINPETGKILTAEEALMPYEFLDEVIWRIENGHESHLDMVESKFLYETKTPVSKEQKIAWLDKFYRRMSTALYKWYILPPSVIVEGRSINKVDYRQPITSGKIDYKGKTQAEIAKELDDI